MKGLFKRMVNLWSLEIAKKSTGTEQSTIKVELDEMVGTKAEEVPIMLAKGLRETFLPKDPNSGPYTVGDMVHFMHWLHDRFNLPTVYKEMPKPVQKTDRLFAPAILFVGADRPAEELAQHLRVYIKEWLPDGQPHETGRDDTENGTVVYFPMTSAAYISWGALLMEQLHAAARGCSADEGSEFMACYAYYAPGGDPVHGSGKDDPTAKGSMFAQLYISNDNGLTWLDRRHLQLKK